MGYGDGPGAEAADLSTVRQPFEETGLLAAQLLLAAITKPQPRSTTRLCAIVVQRMTTGPTTRT
jgi:DNA-binding LacI/PurR family transcriptional regulator